MFAFKKKYYLIIESIKDIDLRKIKKRGKFVIIYRYLKNKEDIQNLKIFRKKCKIRLIDFFVANNLNLAISLNSDGIYLSSYNKSFKALNLIRSNFQIIGSAHNFLEIYKKMKQGCDSIILSKLFKVDYDPKAKFLDTIKFNNLSSHHANLIPLGGIKINNLNKMKTLRSESFAIMSEIKKKPAISSRLF